mgnify:FL=1
MTGIFLWRRSVHRTRHGDSPISAIILYHTGRGATSLPTGQPDRAHAAGWNDKSIGICYEGGLDEQGRPADTRTYAQRCTLMDLLRQLRRDYPEARILGHYQLSPYIRKACPCFDAREEYLVL